MARFAFIRPDNSIDRKATDIDPTVQTKTGWRWLPCSPVAQPAFDSLTEIVEGPAYTVNANDVTEVWTKRAKTAPEIDADKDAAANAVNGPYAPLLKILRNHENRLRLLENAQFGTSKPPLSLADVKAAIKALL